MLYMQNRCSPASITRVFRVTLEEGEGSWERRGRGTGRMNFQRKKMFVPSVMKINLFHLKVKITARVRVEVGLSHQPYYTAML